MKTETLTRVMHCPKEDETGMSYHNGHYGSCLMCEVEELLAEVVRLTKRLNEEIKWGHRNCTRDNCLSSGTDCPAIGGMTNA